MIYFESFTLQNIVACFFNQEFREEVLIGKSASIYYIDSTFVVEKFIVPILGVLGIVAIQLNFKMMDIRDEKDELIRLKIHRVSLFEIQQKMINSDAYKSLYHESWKQGSILDYINKGLIDESVMDPSSVSRILFTIEIVRWHRQKCKCDRSLCVINKRPWFYLYKEYAANYKISLIKVNNFKFKINYSDIHKFIRNHHWLYGILKNVKYKRERTKKSNTGSIMHRLYVEGRGDINFEKNGEHSDFFWQYNSKFPIKNILYKHHSNSEREHLAQHGVYSISEGVVLESKHKRSYIKPQVNISNRFREERKVFESILASYDLDRFYWSSFFKSYGVKLFLSWYKYSKEHMVLSDSINDNDGISVVWQMAFDGFEAAECMLNIDVAFSYSSFSALIEKRQKSKIKYNVIIGYPKDYVGSLLKGRAKILREKLKENGAEKIVFVIDENSNDDPRWHTGHELQRENYSYILEKMLEISWLGVIFKPKTAKTLRKRLGSVAKLLAKAEATGRCYIYETSGRYTTSAPPVLAGLSADICIHSHLCSGTAALECALEGLPTLLLDREGAPSSKLNELPQGKVIFKDWPSIIEAVMEHFSIPQGIPGFGDWSSIINDLDPFRDGMAANRMGTYLHWLIQGYEQGLDKDTIMANAAAQYQEKWGIEKIVCH